MIYTDPDGNNPLLVALFMAYAGGVQANFNIGGNPFNPAEWNWNSSGTYIGIVSGGLGGMMPQANGLFSNGFLQAGIQVGFNSIGNLIDGDPIFEGAGWAAAKGFASGAYAGYLRANENGRNILWGTKPEKFGEGKGVYSLNPRRNKAYYVETVELKMGTVQQSEAGCVPATTKNAGDYLGIHKELKEVEQKMGKPVSLGIIDKENNKTFNAVGLNSEYTDDINEVVAAMRAGNPNITVEKYNNGEGHALNLVKVDVWRRGTKIFYRALEVMDPQRNRILSYQRIYDNRFYILSKL